jgi:hypothetical protein
MLFDGDEIDSNTNLSLNRNSSGSVHMVRGGGRVAIGTNNTGLA